MKSVLDMEVFTSDVRLCLTVGSTTVRRGGRLSRRHFREVTKPSRGRNSRLHQPVVKVHGFSFT